MQKAVVVEVLLTTAMAGCAAAPSQMPVPVHPIANKMPTAPRSARGSAPSPTHKKRIRRPAVVKRGFQDRPESNWRPTGRPISSRWETIVIHHSATLRGGAASFDRHHQDKGWDELGYHFVIGNGVGYADGRIYVSARWDKQMHGAHCKTPDNRYNKHGIGICLIGNLEAHAATYKQIESLARLVSFLSREGDISRSQILTHGGVTNRTACPGRFFSLQPVFRRMLMRSVSASSE